MGFSQKESEFALIEVKNESIEVAVDKVFELKNKSEKKESTLQTMLQQITSSLIEATNTKNKEESVKENKDEIQELLQKKQNLLEEKQRENDELMLEISQFTKKIEDLKKNEIIGFTIATSLDVNESPIIVSGVMKTVEGYILEIKTVSYFTQYLRKIIKQNINTETWLCDGYEMLIDEPVIENPSHKAVKHCLNHSRFSINTLLPLFIGYQTKRNWKLEKNLGPAQIFNESSNRNINLEMFTEIYGVISLKDYFTQKSSSMIGVYGVSTKPIIVPIEISPNKITVSHSIVNI